MSTAYDDAKWEYDKAMGKMEKLGNLRISLAVEEWRNQRERMRMMRSRNKQASLLIRKKGNTLLDGTKIKRPALNLLPDDDDSSKEHVDEDSKQNDNEDDEINNFFQNPSEQQIEQDIFKETDNKENGIIHQTEKHKRDESDMIEGDENYSDDTEEDDEN
ncbi:3007_t:CDS:2 [Paraglomus brasilianum]|uniref:3007_t:CDS:1 n=1 Tax=Paraglomus brasilianum TaxID=144538 RepID=A0A9N9AUZ0_9GLOM|nr:3007_t:CDS:2 [Paraglomus brasilianum]